MDTILGSEGEDAAKARQMLEMFPHLPEDGQTEVAQHLANLTPDQLQKIREEAGVQGDAPIPRLAIDYPGVDVVTGTARAPITDIQPRTSCAFLCWRNQRTA